MHSLIRTEWILPPNWARVAKALGLKFVVSTDAHAIGGLKNLKFGVNMAIKLHDCRKHRTKRLLQVSVFRSTVNQSSSIVVLNLSDQPAPHMVAWSSSRLGDPIGSIQLLRDK